MNNRELDYNLLAKYVAGECTEKELITFRKNMVADKRFTKTSKNFGKIWKSRKSQRAGKWDKKGVWEKIQQEIEKNEVSISPIKPIRTRNQCGKTPYRGVSWLIRLAAVFLVAAITSLFTILYMQDIREDEPSLMREVVTENGQRATVLKDGMVWKSK